ncbi:MAG: F0F1 ATP synthase subunit B' [Bdellovibrionales bacterium]
MKVTQKFTAGGLAAMAAFYAAPLRAADAHGGEAGGKSLPQLDPAHFPEQIFWLAVTFALLYVLMRYVALPGVQKTQDKRAETIASELAAAEAANTAAKDLMAQYEKALADARTLAQASVSETSLKAAQEAAARHAEQQKVLAARLAEAEAKIHAARDEAVRDIKSTASSLAEAIVGKVLGLKQAKG